MIKPKSLRDLLAASITELARDPDRMLVFIDSGSAVSTLAPGRSFEYRYTLHLVITDYAGHPDAVFVPLLDWVRVHQPELLENEKNRERIAFEVDVLANDKVDMSIKLPLTERVGVHEIPGGGLSIEHYPEPGIEHALPPRHWKLYLKDELLAEWDAPAGG